MTVSDARRAKTAAFRRRHVEGDILVLPNAWDQMSAALIAAAGFEAIATTSVGYALANGRPDGETMGRDANIGFAGVVAASAPVPVTADLEAGYGPGPEAVAETVRRAIDAGLVGCNIEDVLPGSDALLPFDAAVARIRAGAEAARAAGVDFVLNGRTDPFLVRHGDAAANFAEAVRRTNAFLEAGAACVYVPGVTDAPTLARLVAAIPGPLNAHTVGGRPSLSLAQYRDLGVRRLSLGGSLMMATLAGLRDTLAAVRAGDLGFAERALSNAAMNRLMRDWAARAG